MSKLQEQVMQFMKMAGQTIEKAPTANIDKSTVRLRMRLVAEETFEFLEACFDSSNLKQHDMTWFDDLKGATMERIDAVHDDVIQPDLPKVVDALGDIDVVVEGSRLAFGVDGGPVADEIHRTNMEKQNGPVDASGKKLKPEGWKPPNIEAILKKQGWKP